MLHRRPWIVLLLALSPVACRSAQEAPAEADLGACCEHALELVEEMPDCCRDGVSTVGAFTGCCAEGLSGGTAQADDPACCRAARVLLEQLSTCCRRTLQTGEAAPCCEGMPSALAARATE